MTSKSGLRGLVKTLFVPGQTCEYTTTALAGLMQGSKPLQSST